MSGIAEILLHSGYRVTGSDLRENSETEKLRKLGAQIFLGHQADNLRDVEAVVFSSAVRPDNPEMIEARKRALTILPRAEMLAELMRKKKSIVVGGAHGKTTTSAMITTILIESGADPTAVIGGKLRNISGNAKMGTDEWFVAESDESDGSFLKLLPLIAVVTNLDREHIGHYGSYEKIEEAFVDFANRVPFDGLTVICKDDSNARKLIPRIQKTTMTYGIEQAADLEAKNVQLTATGSQFDVHFHGRKVLSVRLPLLGKHNVLNALAAIGVALHMELPLSRIEKGLQAFGGLERRLEVKGVSDGIRVIDDYAHHPTEIRASLAALSLMKEKGALRVLFQPHRYSRLEDLWDEFVNTFSGVDQLFVLPVYAASEVPIKNIHSERLVDEIRKKKIDAQFVPSIEKAVSIMVQQAKPGDVLVSMGAGDVTKAGSMILESRGKR